MILMMKKKPTSVCRSTRTVKRSIDVFLIFEFPFWVMPLNKSHKTHHPEGNHHPVLTREIYLVIPDVHVGKLSLRKEPGHQR